MSALGLALSVLIGVSLGFFGGGGSILTVPLLVYVFGLEPKPAIAASLLIVALASISGAAQHARAGNVRLRTALVFGAAGMAGAYLGGRGAAWIDGRVLLLLFAGMMLVTSVAMWRGRRAATAPDAGRHAALMLAAQGLAVGVFTGLVGAGGGFLIVPALALWAGLPMPAAIGTSLVVIVFNSVAGFVGYASHVVVDPGLVAAVAGCAIVGSFAGARLAHAVDPASLRRAFAGFVLVMAAGILVREGSLVAAAAGAALPGTLPQLIFVLLMLGVGILLGRASRPTRSEQADGFVYFGGDGI
jgi:uncharacterized membrane protein YfcA